MAAVPTSEILKVITYNSYEVAMSVDEKLWGHDTKEKCEPVIGDNCLMFDGGMYHKAKVVEVFPEKKLYTADYLDLPIRNEGHYCRFRPIS